MEKLLTEIGTDIMKAIGETFPPNDFPQLSDIFAEIDETGNPYCDDAMISVCVINAKRIAEFLERKQGEL